MEKTVHELVRLMEKEDKSGKTTISKYVNFSMRDTLNKIDAYLNSKHISGSTDSKGRKKPFFNIVTAASNVWYRATDIDRKDIRLNAGKEEHAVLAFLATIHLQEYMRRSNFGAFLNEWGRTLARYGSAVSKFIEKGGKLYTDVIPWNRIICDPIDFENNPKIEILYLTPAQLKKRKEYDQKLVKKLLDALESRETTEGRDKDDNDSYIKLYEIHGELPLSYLTGNYDDEDEYQQQMHVITFMASKENGDEYDDYTLVKGREAKDPYLKDDLIKEDGRTLAIGAVEHLFEAQFIQNHTAKQIKDQLDIASKLIFQTSDAKFLGYNALSAIEQGDVLIHALNQPLTQINNKPDITAIQSYAGQWKALGNEITGVSEAMLGESAKSGTAWRQTEALLMESHSLFEIMTENKGLAIERMMTSHIIPFLKKKMDTKEEISATLEEYQIKQVDAMFVPNEAIRRVNWKIISEVLSGREYTKEEQMIDTEKETEKLQTAMDKLANQRFIKPSDVSTKTWKEVLKDFEWEIEVDITSEAKNTQAIMTTLSNVLSFIQGLQGQPMSPEARLVFNKILNLAGGVSPLELSQAKTTPNQIQQPAVPSRQQSVGAGISLAPQLAQ